MRKFHRVAGAPLRHRREAGGITQHLRERHLRLDHHTRATRLASADPSAPRTQVPHDVPRILVRRVNLDVHHRLEQRWLRLLHRFLERQRAGDFERHVGAVHVVIFAVVKRGPEIHDGKASEKSAFGRSANALLHRRNPVFRNRSAENVIHEFDARAARRRFHADAAHAELAVSAGLFLVFSFGVGLAANRLAVRHFGRLQRQVHVIALVQFRHDDFDVLLSRPGQQELLGLRIARKMQRWVFFQDAVDGGTDAVLIGARLGLHGEGDRRLRKMRQRVMNRRGFVAQRIAGERVLQFRDRAELSGMQFRHRGRRVPLHDVHVL